MKKLILAGLLGLVARVSFAACDPSLAPTYTTRSGLVIPQINSCSWGTVLNNNFSILDSSVAFLGTNNTFTGTNTFGSGALTLRYPSLLTFQNSSGGAGATISNPLGLGLQGLEIVAPHGIGINSSPAYQGVIGVEIYRTDSAYPGGSFAVMASSPDGSLVYSGFIATSTIQTSTLWTLPTADGSNGQLLGTDGGTHLGWYNNTGGGGSGTGGNPLTINQNSVQITSPTLGINMLSPPFLVTAVGGGTTAQIRLDGSSVTMQGPLLSTRNTWTGFNNFSGSTTYSGNVNISSGVLILNNPGTSGQVLTSGGSGAVPAWGSASSTLLTATQTWSGLNNWTTPGQSSFAHGLTVSSLSVVSVDGIQFSDPALSAPAGRYRLLTSGDFLYVMARDAADASNIPLMTFSRFDNANGGLMVLSSSGTKRMTLRFGADTGHFIGLVASQTANSNTYILPATSGTVNQVLGTDGNNNLIFQTVPLLTSTQTWSGTNNWTTPFQSTFTYGLTVGSITVTGQGVWDFAETTAPVGQAGASTLYASSITHTLHQIPNNEGNFTFLISSITPAQYGNKVVWSSYSKVVDGGPDIGVMVPSTFSWLISYPITMSSSVMITGGSTTVNGGETHIGFSTKTIANAYFDVSQSSTALGFVNLSNGYGTSGQFLTSGGTTSSPTWTTASGGSGGSSSVEVIFGVSRTSPTATIIARTPFTGSVTGSTITLGVDYSSFTMLGPNPSLTVGNTVTSSWTVTGAGGIGLNTPITFGLGSTAGHNTYLTNYQDVNSIAMSNSYDNAIGFTWNGSTPTGSPQYMSLAKQGTANPGLLTVAYGINGSTITLTSFNSTASSASIIGPLNMTTNQINNVVDPSAAQDAATKNYVDTNVNSLYWKQSARLATIAALPANTYNNGASGVGATLTEVGFGALSIDGVAPAISDRVLIKNEAASANNGIYSVTAIGSVAAAYVLTRTLDYNQTSEVQAGDSLFITSGTTLANSGWIQVTSGTITMGSSPIVFNQFTGLGEVTAGYGLSATGNTINLVTNTTAYIQNSPTLQSGTTAYPSFLYVGSSAAITSPGFTGTNLSTGTPLSLDSNNLLVSSSGANLYAFTSSGTFTFQKPNWAHAFRVKVCGGGGGGSGGEGEATATTRSGGGGGGGGACHEEVLWAADVANTVTVIVGSGGVSGTGGTATSGVSGGFGSYSSFGSIVAAYGGGPGFTSTTTSTIGGSGGSWGTVGTIGATGVQGAACSAQAANTPGGGGCGGTSAGGGIGKGAESGGGSGGGSIGVTTGTVGGNSARGGSGGGGAGGCNPNNFCSNSAASGSVGANIAQNINLNGGAGGSTAGTSGATCTVGTAGANGSLSLGGTGGGAGGADVDSTGCAGGAGGICGGGGGGGGAGTNVGGAGGAGGVGCVYILAF